MKLTIIPSDKSVYVDGVCHSDLDLSPANIPDDVHALQWDADAGWIEYNNHVKPNEDITALPQWANDCVVIWEQAN
jgi:hypothetical protein